MKTLIVLLAAALASPSFAQTSTTTTDTTTTDSSTMTPTTPSTPTASPNTDTATTSTNLAPATTDPATTTTSSTETTSRAYRETDSEYGNKGGFFIEPAIFGAREDVELKTNALGQDVNGVSNGFGADLKLGAHVGEIFFIGADGRYARTELSETAYEEATTNAWNVGPTAGVQMPFFGVRAWGTYVLDGNVDPEAGAAGTDLRFKDPYGWRVGAGIRLAAVSLNLEYQDLTYRTTELQSVGDLNIDSESGIDFTQRGYAVSLSFPIEL